jgi:flagellar biosynthesis protein FlhB
MFKNLFSKTGWVTTLSVVVQVVLVALAMFGVFTPEEKENIQGAWNNFATALQSGGGFPIAFGAITVIQQLMLALAKDPKLTEDATKPK